MSDLKYRLESILFSAGQKISLEELSRLTKERDLERIKQALHELKMEQEQKGSSIMLIQEGDCWKMTIREKYLPFVRKIVTQTELPKSVIETLAVVAFKAPVLQSKIISIRTNKAYKHLDFLEEDGYVTREKKGRTKLIKLTKKFFEYFDIPPEELKKKFEGFKDLEKVLEKKEEQHEAESERAEEITAAVAKEPEVDLVAADGKAEKLKVYDEEPKTEVFEREEIPPPLELAEDKLGELETYGEKEKKEEKHKKKHKKKKEKEERKEEETSEAAEEGADEEAEETPTEEETAEEERPAEEPEEERITVEKIEKEAGKAKTKPKKYESTGLFKGEIPTELEKKISNRAEEIVYGEKEAEEEETKEDETEETEMPEEEQTETAEETEEPTEPEENTEKTEEPEETEEGTEPEESTEESEK